MITYGSINYPDEGPPFFSIRYRNEGDNVYVVYYLTVRRPDGTEYAAGGKTIRSGQIGEWFLSTPDLLPGVWKFTVTDAYHQYRDSIEISVGSVPVPVPGPIPNSKSSWVLPVAIGASLLFIIGAFKRHRKKQ